MESVLREQLATVELRYHQGRDPRSFAPPIAAKPNIRPLPPPERQISRAPPLRAGFGLVARRRPACPGHAPIVGAAAPSSGTSATPGSAGASSPRNRRCRWRSATRRRACSTRANAATVALRDQAPLVVAALRPGVGIEQIDARQASPSGAASTSAVGVVAPDAHIVEPLPLDRRPALPRRRSRKARSR